MFSTFIQKASGLSESLQSVQDRLPETFQSLKNAKVGASKVQDDLLAKIGTKRQIKTEQGLREVVEICLVGGSPNVTKVRCLASEKEFVLKRMCLGNPQKNINDKTGLEKGPAERANAMVSLEALQTLADKAEMLPSLGEHPNVVKCFSSQVDNTSRSHGHVFLMEICDGSVASILESKGSMSAEEVLAMTKDVVAGLEFLHGQKEGPITHGSVETSHVLKGKKGEWKLAGFGATSFDGESPASAKVKSDVWQLGVLIFMSLFGVHPFGGKGQDSEAAMSLKKGCALPVPHGRPRSLLEGRLCILVHWLLVPDAALRPTAKQVGVLLGHLERMVASQIMKTLPPPIRKMVGQTMLGAERQTLVEGLNSIPTETGIRLVKEFGEDLLRNPRIISASKLQEVMPRAIMSRIKELHTLYGIPEGSYSNVKVASPKKSDPSEGASKADGVEQDTANLSEHGETEFVENQEKASLDLMDGPQGFEDKPEVEQERTQTEVDLMDGPRDLLDMDEVCHEVPEKQDSNKQQDLLILDTCDEITHPQQSPESGSTKQASTISLDLLDFDEQPAVTPCTDSGDLLDMGSPSKPQSPPQEMSGDLLDMGSTFQPQCPPQEPASLDLLDFGVTSDTATKSSTEVSLVAAKEDKQQASVPGDLLFF
jgi:serine/threonine protein kinase